MAVLATLTYGLEISSKDMEILKECRTKNNISLGDLLKGAEKQEIPTTENGKCFLQCVMEKAGVIKDDKINVDRAKAINAKKLKDKPDFKDKADKIADLCSKEVTKPDGKCEFAVKISECAMKHAKEMGVPQLKFGV
uniref:Odorant-binding protein 21 n=1 Tax=Yemma signatus TaxID=300820 RepID=A0A3G2KPI2_9HEMI|nr:odorant-binding protein 21 [Yemma signatus]